VSGFALKLSSEAPEADKITATWKVRLPGKTSSISIHFVPMLFAISELSLPKVLLMGVAGGPRQGGMAHDGCLRPDFLPGGGR
jgi:hypothetical protein